MGSYEVNVLRKDQTVAAYQAIVVSHSRALWPRVAELAWSVGESGGQIRVIDHAGELVILVGVDSARRSFARPSSPVGRKGSALAA